ncbi:BnaA07g03230D [Brassica napus]|uniref:BnaA07g03230D protein n=1 Tax=Brassica napus TaxID=3708 RepID=A0A078H3H4_BRANA|nr:BnaA07g03230D [Brassica napus]
MISLCLVDVSFFVVDNN